MNREQLENGNWLLERFYETESRTINRLAYKNRDDVSVRRCRMPLVKLMLNSLETENTLVETDNALGDQFKLLGKLSGAVFTGTRCPTRVITLTLFFNREIRYCTQIFGAGH